MNLQNQLILSAKVVANNSNISTLNSLELCEIVSPRNDSVTIGEQTKKLISKKKKK